MIRPDVTAAADARGYDPRTVAAIVEVESAGAGLADDGRPVILYEPHVAWRAAPERLRPMMEAAGAAYRKWGEQPYPRSQALRWAQFEACERIAGRDVAIQACSWGLGQVLGENWRVCGFGSPAMFEVAQRTEAGQVETMLRFLEGHDLEGAINARDWRRIARVYNGPGQVDRYAALMEAAYRKLGGEPSPEVLRLGDSGAAVRELQRLLGEEVDGRFGSATEAAVTAFQRDAGLVPDGVVGARTWGALRERGAKPPAQPTPAQNTAEKARGPMDAAAGTVIVASGTAAVSSPKTAQEWSDALGVPVVAVVIGAAALLVMGPRLARRFL